MTARAAITLAALACTAMPVSAQRIDGSLGGGVAYEYFSFSSPERVLVESLSLLTVPLAARIRLARALDFEVSSAWASASLERTSGTESTFDGPTDTEVRGSYTVGRDLLTLTALAILPTGAESLTAEEADVAGAIAADVLPLRISNWGTGGGFGGSAALAVPLGSVAAGISVGYVSAREFEPLTGDNFTYRPGNQVHVRVALDRTFGTSSKLALVLATQQYSDDEIDGGNLFRTGDRYEAIGSYAFAAGERAAAIAYFGYLHRGEGEFQDDTFLVPSQDLAFGGVGLDTYAGSVRLRPSVDVRVLRRDDGVGQGWTAQAGGTVEIPAGWMTLAPTVRGRFGNLLLQEDAESRFAGFEAALAIRFGRIDP
jgi:hypothetical protein